MTYTRSDVHHLLDVFSPEENAALLAKCQSFPAQHVSVDGYAKDYRDNFRAIFHDKELVKTLIARIRHALPPIIDPVERGAVYVDKKWHLTTLNDCWRYCWYETGGKFGKHQDSTYAPSTPLGGRITKSKMTVMLYLSSSTSADPDTGDFGGGETRFFFPDSTGMGGADNETRYDVAAQAGSCVIFPHEIVHCGLEVQSLGLTAGKKHILRTEAMYELR